MRRDRIWAWWLTGGLAAAAGYLVLPADTTVAELLYDATGLLAALAIAGAAKLHRPSRPLIWYLFAAGIALSVLGDAIFDMLMPAAGGPAALSVADLWYFFSYPALAAGMLLILRQRPGRGLERLLEAAIIATGVGLVLWIFVLHPFARDSGTTLADRWVATAYPAIDVVLVALALLLLAGAGGRRPAASLLTVAALLLLAGDVAYSLLTLYAGGTTPLVNALYLLAYAFWAAAALHPAAVTGQPAALPEVRTRRLWLTLFAASSLLGPALLLMPRIGGDPSDRRAVAIGSIVLFLLVVTRLAGYMRQVRRQQAQLHRLAMTDDLTGLANRRALERALRSAAADGRPQIALFGLNGFKNVNDELGRPAADQVLTVVAARLVAGAPDGALVARTGGDEFAVLLTDSHAQFLLATAFALTGDLGSPVSADGRDLLVGVSVGMAGGAGVDPVELLRQAEVAMHAAKRAGEPVRWSPALDQRDIEHAQLGAELRLALDAGQFRVVYQPIVELPSGRTTAVEALVRWEHPVRGLVSPAAFIPVAEQNGLIVELGAWIMRTACARLALWRASLGSSAPGRISVNVSAKQLARPGFPGFVAEVLAETGLPASCLTVEVTETAVFEGGPAVVALHELRALGVRVALDDFGTGHSSLGLLQTVPVDTIKVDKSFVDDITEAGRPTVIAEALIRLSGGLGLSAVAEGVETAEQAAALTRLGYRYLQGYHYGRPMADPEFASFPVAA
ncbi:putative bifunctional diguanylate cyclase/phosphodiesterase [Actinoplanes sp. CA-030573]|uniref:putative bifunctional diguanylate cyclase/phosphodiesterase n=1 Tax=Actinoplanes sp. CA-030573 TaxID=3239898 RepID=UPI003D8B93E8